jgi:hypothetical protein
MRNMSSVYILHMMHIIHTHTHILYRMFAVYYIPDSLLRLAAGWWSTGSLLQRTTSTLLWQPITGSSRRNQYTLVSEFQKRAHNARFIFHLVYMCMLCILCILDIFGKLCRYLHWQWRGWWRCKCSSSSWSHLEDE